MSVKTKFVNRSIFGEDVDKSVRFYFILAHPVYHIDKHTCTLHEAQGTLHWWGIAYRYSQAEMGVGPGPLCKFFLDGFE